MFLDCGAYATLLMQCGNCCRTATNAWARPHTDAAKSLQIGRAVGMVG